MNSRIRKLRKMLDLTQAEFAEQIGSTANVLTHYETGRRNPSNSVINNICKTFKVNEAWLRFGEGEMLRAAPSAALDALAADYKLSHGDYILIEKFLNLNQSDRTVIIDYIQEVAEALKFDDTPADMPEIDEDLSVDEKTERYRKQLLEEKEAEGRSLASLTDTGNDKKMA